MEAPPSPLPPLLLRSGALQPSPLPLCPSARLKVSLPHTLSFVAAITAHAFTGGRGRAGGGGDDGDDEDGAAANEEDGGFTSFSPFFLFLKNAPGSGGAPDGEEARRVHVQASKMEAHLSNPPSLPPTPFLLIQSVQTARVTRAAAGQKI